MSTRPTALIVEDEGDLREIVAESLEAAGFAVAQSADAADAMARLEGFAYDALVLDLRLPDGDGFAVLDAALTRYPSIKAIVTTGSGGIHEAVTAIKRGAVDFLAKPFSLEDLAHKLRRSVGPAAGSLVEDPPADTRGLGSFDRIVGCSPAMNPVFATLARVSGMNSTVLIQGETGTGKELIARTIHENSPRRRQPFVAFNAAAIPEGLIEAELFGHVKGAFTGAVSARTGRFEAAHLGTLFIDEVASMSLTLQAKLLRALQEREIERVGDSKPIKFDVRLIGATNVNLRKLVQSGAFREDLFYRLNVVPISLPPLRARREDIAILAHHFVEKSCRHNSLSLRPLTQSTLRALMAYSWPGNIRQLENAMEHAVAMSGGEAEIVVDMLPEDIRHPDQVELTSPVTIPDEGIDFASVVSQLERELILRCLQKTGGNKRQAARLLNLSRTTLIDKLQRLGPGATSTID
jgi:two-component system, NtrC family, response regulator AtoC